MRMLPPVLMMVLAISAVQHDAFPQGLVLAGELRLEGRVEKMEQGRLVIMTDAFVNPSGKRGQIAPAKTKIVAVPLKGTPPELKVGERVAVTGRDGGAGKPLVAREIIRLKVPVVPAPTSVPVPVPIEPEVVRPQDSSSLLQFDGKTPLRWQAGNLEVGLEKAGFDYPTRFLPNNFSAIERTPVFYSIFQIRGLPKGDTNKRLVIRRLLGERGEFVQPNGIEIVALKSQGDTARVVFWNSKVDPSWEFVDMDVDTIFRDNPPDKGGAELVLENLTLPREGEAPVNGEAISQYGTHYRAVKVKAINDHQWHLVVRHERAAQPRDLEIIGFSYRGDAVSGGGGLPKGNAVIGENEIFLTLSPGINQIKHLVIQMKELSRSQQKRDGIKRQRVRFPLRDLLKQAPPVPLNKALPVLGEASEGGITARIEGQGLWGRDEIGALVFARGTSEDARRGIRWLFQKGTIRFLDRADVRDLSIMSGDFGHLWHVDATPKGPDESVQHLLLRTPPGVTRGSAEIQLEGRTMLTTSFERTIDLPLRNGVVDATDDGENTLTLQKMQRFSRPEDLAEFPEWIRGGWPNAGIALVFAGNSLLGDSELLPRCLDAEDDQGRPLQTGVVLGNALYQIDVTRKGESPMYSLLLGEPAADAKFIKIWLSTQEKGRAVRKQTLQLKDVAMDPALFLERAGEK